MIGKSLINRWKWDAFPEWRPFTSNLDHIRHEKNVNKLTYKEWFFGHPSSLLLLYYGSDVVLFFLGSIGIYFSIIKNIIYIGIIPAIVLILSILSLFKKIPQYNYMKHSNMYDFMLKEETENVFKELEI